MLKRHQRGDLTTPENKVDYLPFAKVLYEERNEFKRFGAANGSTLLSRRLKNESVVLHFRREDSRNHLSGIIPGTWFCVKFALSVPIPRKGKHSQERVNPP